jgi:DNA-binding CsgD family transcriptional regulator
MLGQASLFPTFVGRTQQVDTLLRLLEAARAGHGQLALISGEAGIGKTRLVRELVAIARKRGWTILDGQCFPQDHLCTYAPFLDLLRTHFTQRSDELAAFRQGLASLVPDLLPIPPGTETSITLDPEQEKRRRFAALTRLFVQQAAEQPLLLVVEDIHWSDDVSLELLFTLTRQIANHRILLALTYRGDEHEELLLPWLAQLERARLGQEIVLTRLELDDVAVMLRAMFALDRPVRADFLEALYTLTEGNPFFIEEAVKAMIAGGEIFYHDGAWDRRPLAEIRIPHTIYDAVQRGAAQISAPARRVLTLAAVVGRRFDFTLLLTLSDLQEAELIAALKELVATQLIVEESSERFAFRHALAREAIYAGLLARERVALHRTIGEAIERLAVESVDQHLPELAYHFFEAQQWEQAFTYGRGAGEHALLLDAPHVAVEQLTRALEAAERLSITPDAALWRLRGQAYETVGEFERAREDLTAALRLAREDDDRRAEWEALLALGMLWSSRDYEQAGEFFRQALKLARRLDDPAALAHSLNRVGNWRLNADSPRSAERYHHEAFVLFRSLDDRRGLAETLDLLGMATCMAGDARKGVAYFQEAADAFRALNDRAGLVTPLAMQCVLRDAYLATDGCMRTAPLDVDHIIEQGEEAIRSAQESGWRAGAAFAQFELAMSFGARGAYAHALDLAHHALATAEEIEHRQWIIGSHTVLGRLYLDLLAFPQAWRHLEFALDLARNLHSSNWTQIAGGMLAMTYLRQGKPGLADAVLAAQVDLSGLPRWLGQRVGWSARAELALAQGDPALALRILELLRATQPDGSDPILGLWRLRGEAEVAQGKLDDAEATLREALTAAKAFGLRPILWRIHCALARIYQKQRRQEEARIEIAATDAIVAALADDVPDHLLRETFLREARMLLPSLRATTPRQAARQAFSGLTAREREVAAEISRGKSNREIAADLVVSERTVEYHVGNIMGKLGVSSRSQVAVWAVEHGLASPAS